MSGNGVRIVTRAFDKRRYLTSARRRATHPSRNPTATPMTSSRIAEGHRFKNHGPCRAANPSDWGWEPGTCDLRSVPAPKTNTQSMTRGTDATHDRCIGSCHGVCWSSSGYVSSRGCKPEKPRSRMLRFRSGCRECRQIWLQAGRETFRTDGQSVRPHLRR
jgi:hypothetical protein